MFQFVQEARDQTQPGSLFSRSGGRGERDPGNEVAATYDFISFNHSNRFSPNFCQNVSEGYAHSY